MPAASSARPPTAEPAQAVPRSLAGHRRSADRSGPGGSSRQSVHRFVARNPLSTNGFSASKVSGTVGGPPYGHAMTDLLDTTGAPPGVAALDLVREGVDALASTELWQLGNDDLRATLLELHRLQRRAQAEALRVLREVDHRGAALELGATSTSAWLVWGLQMHPGAARRAVRDARALHSAGTGPLVPDDGDDDRGLAVTRAAFAVGALSGEQVSEIVAAVEALPPEVEDETRRRGEEFLVEQARVHGPHQLARLGKHLLHTLHPAGDERLARLERYQHDHQYLAITRRRGGGFRLRGDVDDVLGASLLTVLDPLAAPRPADAAGPDLRSQEERYADAFGDFLRIAMGGDGLPTTGGQRPTLMVTVELDSLRRRLGTLGGELAWAGPVSATTARLLGCDAGVIPVVLGASGEPLDVGRLSYPVTLAIRRALEARDKGCAFPGCERPPTWCAAHHIEHWADGGPTAVDNLVLLCDRHHVVVHHGDWSVRVAGDGLPEFTPPPWVDPTQSPISRPWRSALQAVRASPPTPPLRH